MTFSEILECCKDVKVLGMKELRLLKKWREILRADFEKEVSVKPSSVWAGLVEGGAVAE